VARQSVERALPDVAIAEFMTGDWRAIHLRDGCAHLPFTGRPFGHPAILGTDASQVEVRMPTTSVLGSLWQVLRLDRRVGDAISTSRSMVASRLGQILGRPASTRDLSLLGPSCPALAEATQAISHETLLDQLIPPS
jgi:hypothetical protein